MVSYIIIIRCMLFRSKIKISLKKVQCPRTTWNPLAAG